MEARDYIDNSNLISAIANSRGKMPDPRAGYRKLTKYKYQLMKDFSIDIKLAPEADIDTDFISLSSIGLLTIKNRYAWDGPSGPTFDTRDFMRGSLIHDALYQLMREKHLDYQKDRDYADRLLRKICRDDGMSRFRSWYVYWLVKWFGEKSAKPKEKAADEIIWVP